MAKSKSKQNKRKARDLSSLDRRSRHQRPRKSILIVCEGKATEPNYFKSDIISICHSDRREESRTLQNETPH